MCGKSSVKSVLNAITETLRMRTFWDMQQNLEIHKNADWQDKMMEIEVRISDEETQDDFI